MGIIYSILFSILFFTSGIIILKRFKLNELNLNSITISIAFLAVIYLIWYYTNIKFVFLIYTILIFYIISTVYYLLKYKNINFKVFDYWKNLYFIIPSIIFLIFTLKFDTLRGSNSDVLAYMSTGIKTVYLNSVNTGDPYIQNIPSIQASLFRFPFAIFYYFLDDTSMTLLFVKLFYSLITIFLIIDLLPKTEVKNYKNFIIVIIFIPLFIGNYSINQEFFALFILIYGLFKTYFHYKQGLQRLLPLYISIFISYLIHPSAVVATILYIAPAFGILLIKNKEFKEFLFLVLFIITYTLLIKIFFYPAHIDNEVYNNIGKYSSLIRNNNLVSISLTKLPYFLFLSLLFVIKKNKGNLDYFVLLITLIFILIYLHYYQNIFQSLELAGLLDSLISLFICIYFYT